MIFRFDPVTMLRQSISIAVSDICNGYRRFSTSFWLALEDLKDRYRRSVLGVLWIVISFIGFLLIKLLVFKDLFDSGNYDFFSHLVIGFAIFTYMSAIIPDGANMNVANRSWILSSNFPYTLYVNRLVMRAACEFGLIGIASFILIKLYGNVNPGNLWTILPAISVYYVASIGTCYLLAPIGTRFRDVVHAVRTMMRMVFFATPIIWIPAPGTIRAEMAKWNPFTYYIDIIRAPIITGKVPVDSWVLVLVMTAILLAAGMVVFTLTKRKVPGWL